MFKSLDSKKTNDIITYAKQQWDLHNKKYFGGKLKKGAFYILKDMGTGFRALGKYYPQRNWIGLNRRLVLAGEKSFNKTLLHEMCHQAVDQIDGIRKEGNGGHGPYWAKWMRKCGLPPNRYNDEERAVFTTPEEQKKLEQDKKNYIKKQEDKKKAEATSKFRRLYLGRYDKMRPAQFFSPESKEWIPGLIVCPNDQQGKRYAFITYPSSSRWRIIPADWLYELPDKDAKKFTTSEYTNAAEAIIRYLESKSQMRSDRRQMRNLFRF